MNVNLTVSWCLLAALLAGLSMTLHETVGAADPTALRACYTTFMMIQFVFVYDECKNRARFIQKYPPDIVFVNGYFQYENILSWCMADKLKRSCRQIDAAAIFEVEKRVVCKLAPHLKRYFPRLCERGSIRQRWEEFKWQVQTCLLENRDQAMAEMGHCAQNALVGFKPVWSANNLTMMDIGQQRFLELETCSERPENCLMLTTVAKNCGLKFACEHLQRQRSRWACEGRPRYIGGQQCEGTPEHQGVPPWQPGTRPVVIEETTRRAELPRAKPTTMTAAVVSSRLRQCYVNHLSDLDTLIQQMEFCETQLRGSQLDGQGRGYQRRIDSPRTLAAYLQSTVQLSWCFYDILRSACNNIITSLDYGELQKAVHETQVCNEVLLVKNIAQEICATGQDSQPLLLADELSRLSKGGCLQRNRARYFTELTDCAASSFLKLPAGFNRTAINAKTDVQAVLRAQVCGPRPEVCLGLRVVADECPNTAYEYIKAKRKLYRCHKGTDQPTFRTPLVKSCYADFLASRHDIARLTEKCSTKDTCDKGFGAVADKKALEFWCKLDALSARCTESTVDQELLYATAVKIYCNAGVKYQRRERLLEVDCQRQSLTQATRMDTEGWFCAWRVKRLAEGQLRDCIERTLPIKFGNSDGNCKKTTSSSFQVSQLKDKQFCSGFGDCDMLGAVRVGCNATFACHYINHLQRMQYRCKDVSRLTCQSMTKLADKVVVGDRKTVARKTSRGQLQTQANIFWVFLLLSMTFLLFLLQ